MEGRKRVVLLVPADTNIEHISTVKVRKPNEPDSQPIDFQMVSQRLFRINEILRLLFHYLKWYLSDLGPT